MFEPRIDAIYCDDIREEVGNKRSLMGIYHTDMLVQNFPVVLPRLCFYVTLITDINSPAEKVEVMAVKGKEEDVLISTGLIEPPEMKIEHGDLGIPFENRSLVLAFALSPFLIEKETVLRVIAKIGTKKIYGQILRIRAIA